MNLIRLSNYLLRAALVANCLRGAFPPVDFLAVCLVRAIFQVCKNNINKKLSMKRKCWQALIEANVWVYSDFVISRNCVVIM